jgi:uncharacterized membrane protein
MINAVRFLSVLFCALALAPALAHVLELPNKIGMSREEYVVAQQLYRGWWMLGIVVFGALLSTLWLTIVVRRRRPAFIPALIAFLAIAGTQVVFWTFTFPMNQRTANWTVLPDGWAALRMQWEYSHAASAVLNLVALVAVIVSVLARRDGE